MRPTRARWLVGATAAAAGMLYVSSNWLRYGHPKRPKLSDRLLDRFMPDYEVREHHEISVAAPADVTFTTALEQDLSSHLIDALFATRQLIMRAPKAEEVERPSGGMLPLMVSFGWVILAHEAGREIVFGTVTKPWEKNARFESVPADEFEAFDEPGYVKIALTLAAERRGELHSKAITETRVIATDDMARRNFRRYWTLVVPGVRLIRREMLRIIKRAAERRYEEQSE